MGRTKAWRGERGGEEIDLWWRRRGARDEREAGPTTKKGCREKGKEEEEVYMKGREGTDRNRGRRKTQGMKVEERETHKNEAREEEDGRRRERLTNKDERNE